ncbi:MAG: hypothetical protein A4E71_02558 [Smithella sp. PtaU1.Bin162]|nr:MAG: hypothetical protein A4E71_02558 [Smithella sp. PtaU1.Bin162]
MFDRLNFAQRLLLTAIAVVILLFQLYKFNENSIEGSGWILSFLVAGLLLLPILSGVNIKKSSANKTSCKECNNPITLHIDREKNQWAVKQIRNRAPGLDTLLRDWMEFKTVEEALNKRFDDIFADTSHVFLFMITAIAEGSLDTSFFQSDRFYVLKLQIAELMIEENIKGLRGLMPDKEPNKDLVTKQVINRLNEATKVIDEYIDAILAKSKDPEAPLVEWMLKSLNLDTLAETEKVKRRIRANLGAYVRSTMRELRGQRLLNTLT